MLCVAQVYHTQPHNLTASARNIDHATHHFTYLDAVSPDRQCEISGCGFFCVMKENTHG
jgi:hypothetical protein